MVFGWLASSMLTAVSAAAVGTWIPPVTIYYPTINLHIARYSRFAVIWNGDATHKHNIHIYLDGAQTNFPVTTVDAGVHYHLFPDRFLTTPGKYTVSVVPTDANGLYDITKVPSVNFFMDN